MHTKRIAELAALLANKEISSVELTQHFLARIKQYDPALNSFITVTEKNALAQAKAADAMIAAGTHTPLTGIPLAQKDIFCTKGVRSSAGSHMLDKYLSPYDAHVVENFNHAGAVMLGKTNMDDAAMGSSNETSYYGPVKNPWDLEKVPGGSSGGSAAAVAALLAPGATGTDTGGSIRQPASLCGITGLKPTYGRVSRYGMIAFASSLDQGGPMARSAEDAAMMLQAMAGFDKRDSTCVDRDVPDYAATLDDNIKGLRVGLPKEYFTDDLDPAIAETVHAAAKQLEAQGATLHEISLPNSPAAITAYYVVAPAECSSNLARYDGVRYGHRCEDPKDLRDLYCRTRAEGFGEEVKRRIMIGTYVLSAGYYDAYYIKAQQVRRLIRDEFQAAFKDVDVILGPTSPGTAFNLGAKTDDPISMYLADIYTIAANLAGLPALSAPAGFVKGLPVGFQLIGNYFDEAKLLNVTHQYQQHTDWHLQSPNDFV